MAQAMPVRRLRDRWAGTSLGLRVGIAAGSGVLVAVVGLSVVVYLMVEAKLREDIDESLGRRNDVPVDAEREVGERRPDELLTADRYLQVVDPDGNVVQQPAGGAGLVVDDDVVEVARGERDDYYADVEALDGTPVRVHVTRSDGTAIMFGRSLTELEGTLDQLLLVLLGASLAGLAVAFAVGRLAARTAVRPVHRMSQAAEAVASTGDLSHHIPVRGGDELARLAGNFNRMLDALDASLREQRQLVADASHELRTPLTSVRTNVEVLQRAAALPPAERDELLRDVVGQLEELTRLVEDLVELGRGRADEESFGDVDLDEVVERVVRRARRHHPRVAFRLAVQPSRVWGAEGRVERAVGNLVDNAAKWSPPDGAVDVAVDDRAVTVSDAGPGIDPADEPHLFDRFYRSANARGMPGSGLGLAIVRQVVDSHRGEVTVTRADTGGASFTLRLPPPP